MECSNKEIAGTADCATALKLHRMLRLARQSFRLELVDHVVFIAIVEIYRRSKVQAHLLD